MYRKRDKSQLTLEDFILPFSGKLLTENRWVKLTQLMPWDYIEDVYARSMSPDNGARAIRARIAFGALYIKENENLSDERTVEAIAENPYMQYFLGLHEYTAHPLFDSSMMVHFRKRFPAEETNRINRLIFSAQKREDNQDDPPPGDRSDSGEGSPPGESPPAGEAKERRQQDGMEGTTAAEVPNEGKLVLDATCAPADIRYPSDISLLNEARENTEAMLERLWEQGPKEGRKTRYHRKKARGEYLAITKQKQPKTAKIRKAIAEQLRYIALNLEDIGQRMMRQGTQALREKDLERLMTICRLHRQQQAMWRDETHTCPQRIVSLRQPHVRPIVRGKAGKRVEFGQKVALSVVRGYTFIERQSFENFNEGTDLIPSVERYKQIHGCYPQVVQADQIYRNRENLAYCKARGIRLSGPRLGRPGKDAAQDRFLAYRDLCERNIIEGRAGMAKRRFGLGLIMAYLPETALTEAAFQLLCMNARIRLLLRLLFSLDSFYLALA